MTLIVPPVRTGAAAVLATAGAPSNELTVAAGAAVPPVHADQSQVVGELARASTPESLLRRIEAVLACRDAIDANVNPLLACESMALALRAG